VPAGLRTALIVTGGAIAVATVLVVTLLVVFPAPPQKAIGCPCGEPPFAIGAPFGPLSCGSSPAGGCLDAADYYYTISIETSSLTFGEVHFRVDAANGTVYTATPDGGFSIVNLSGYVVAEFDLPFGGPLAFQNTSSWIFTTNSTGISSGSHLGNDDSLVVDMGSRDPGGRGLVLVAVGTGVESGGSASVDLP
jgi:hypothetical protein